MLRKYWTPTVVVELIDGVTTNDAVAFTLAVQFIDLERIGSRSRRSRSR